MRDVELFQKALGLESPWYVERTEFDAEGRRLDLYIDFERGARFWCPECGTGGCPAHDTTEKRWRHLNFFQHEAYLRARVPRVACEECGVKQVEVPWARRGSGFTLLFESLMLEVVKHMPVAAAARIVGEHDTRIWRHRGGRSSPDSNAPACASPSTRASPRASFRSRKGGSGSQGWSALSPPKKRR